MELLEIEVFPLQPSQFASGEALMACRETPWLVPESQEPPEAIAPLGFRECQVYVLSLRKRALLNALSDQ
jgi:hypothetical protein